VILAAALLALCPLSVIDGDTIRHQCERVRIAGIDAPELRARCPSERRLALQARDRLAELMREPFVLRGYGRDRYGRQLRQVIRRRDGLDIGQQLVSEGLARTWTGRREGWCGSLRTRRG
jgi:endonuclease YncB( thermonuclease family)